VYARPHAVFESAALASIVDALFPPAAQERVELRTGIRAHALAELVLGVYPDGFLALLRGPWRARDVVLVGEQRMSSIDLSAEAPFVWRGGFDGAAHRDFIAVGQHVVVVAGGATRSPERLGALIARIDSGSFAATDRPALEAGLDAYRALEENPIVALWPERLEFPAEAGVAALLAREDAMAVGVDGGPRGTVEVRVVLTGAFPSTASENFRALVGSVAESDLGHALGVAAALSTLRIQVDDGAVRLHISLASRDLRGGLRMLFSAEIRELLGASPEPSRQD
jgi:hypothetical protein